MSSQSDSEASRREEPVTVTDRRRIDPDTGTMRQPDSLAVTPDGVNESELLSADSADLNSKVEELTADLQRAHADFVNYKRRVERDRLGVIEAARASVISELLIVVDDLDRAREHGDLNSGPMKAVADKLAGVLSSQGLVAFGEVGDNFDPALHEAVQNEGEGSDLVLGSVLRKGYRFGDRVLRTALVSVVDRTEAQDNLTDDGGNTYSTEA